MERRLGSCGSAGSRSIFAHSSLMMRDAFIFREAVVVLVMKSNIDRQLEDILLYSH
jgi:hypothetical protein